MLSGPSSFATCDGSPKIPLPRMQFTTSATRLQRPMARTSPSSDTLVSSVSVTAILYHKYLFTKSKNYDGSSGTRLQSSPIAADGLFLPTQLGDISVMTKPCHCVFIAGGTGYVGQRLIRCLLDRGHQVRALVRSGSEKKVPSGCTPIPGNALDGSSYSSHIAPADTFVQLVGVAHPSPRKAVEFRQIDLPSALEAVAAAKSAGIRHFVYVSVAHPAPMMHAYIAVRSECEAAIESAGLNATILRPWYVLGPGHRWPYLLLPIYRVAEMLPQTRDGARRLGLVTLEQMTSALTVAVENPTQGIRIVSVPEIRAAKT
jgi:uncharacterized protein YbjT (DUF2867 family)